jgi:hypothetical protein
VDNDPCKGEASANYHHIDRHGRGEASDNRLDLNHGLLMSDASPLRYSQTDALPIGPNGTRPGSLNAIIQNYKSTVARKINAQRGSPRAPVWQRNYYEHIIRNEKSHLEITQYILDNPMKWELD